MYNSIVNLFFTVACGLSQNLNFLFFLLKAWITSSPFGEEKKLSLVEAATKLV
jgi:hypothetical protein